jgi:hypothetical protein
MKPTEFIIPLLALATIYYVLTRSNKETFVPEFLDQRGVAKTSGTRQSSYKQDTNHFVPMENPQDPIPGVKTAFRVNMYDSYMV